MYSAILEQIRQVLGNIVRTSKITQNYVDNYDPRTGILAAAEFSIISITSKMKGYSPYQLVSGRDMILPIKHKVNW